MEEMDEEKEQLLLEKFLENRHRDTTDKPTSSPSADMPRGWPEMAFKVVFPLASTALASAVRVLVERFLEG